jgi:AraC-like DNA-binding protein
MSPSLKRALDIERADVPCGKHLAGHAHASNHMCVVLRGGFEEEDADKIRECRAGTARISPRGTAHDLQFGSGGATCLVFEAPGPFWARAFGRVLRHTGGSSAFVRVAGSDLSIFESMRSSMDVVSACNGMEAMGRIFATVCGRIDAPRPAWFEDAVAALEEPSAERMIGKIARSARLHRVQFSREFLAHSGWRPVEYRSLKRAARAAALLKSSDASIADIAAECGYSHQSHLSNGFSAFFGVTPAALR